MRWAWGVTLAEEVKGQKVAGRSSGNVTTHRMAQMH